MSRVRPAVPAPVSRPVRSILRTATLLMPRRSAASFVVTKRQREGIALAKARGVYKGRKRALDPDKVSELVARAAAGVPKAQLAREYGLSRETVYQYLRRTDQETLERADSI